MRTTIRVDDQLLAKAKEAAARSGRTLTAVIEDALRESLARSPRVGDNEPFELPVSEQSGGVRAGVDIDDSASLLDLMEADDRPV